MDSTISERDVRLFVYRHFVPEGRAPTILEVEVEDAPKKTSPCVFHQS
jgi:hypothetical protein